MSDAAHASRVVVEKARAMGDSPTPENLRVTFTLERYPALDTPACLAENVCSCAHAVDRLSVMVFKDAERERMHLTKKIKDALRVEAEERLKTADIPTRHAILRDDRDEPAGRDFFTRTTT